MITRKRAPRDISAQARVVEPAERGSRIPHHQLQEILTLFDRYRKQGKGLQESYELIGEKVGRSTKMIGVTINRLRPTAGAARLYLQSRAYKMARKLVAEADAPLLMELLSRPSLGVIDPPQKTGGGEGGFFLSVTAESCGAVKVAVATQQALPAAPDPMTPFNPYEEKTDEVPESYGLTERAPTVGRSKTTQAAIESAKERLAEARRRAEHQEDESVWLLDGHAEGEEATGGVLITHKKV